MGNSNIKKEPSLESFTQLNLAGSGDEVSLAALYIFYIYSNINIYYSLATR